MWLARLLVVTSLIGCGDDGRIGVSIMRVVDLVENQGRDSAEVSVFVSRDCFYSVSVEGVLLASGRWAGGERRVRLSAAVLERCDNTVRIQVAAEDGTSGADDAEVWWCRDQGCIGECDGSPPDAGVGLDSGVVDRYPGPLCDPCTNTAQCGGFPNLCVSVEGAGQGLCGTECFGPEDCPVDFACLAFQDDVGNIVTEVCLPWPAQPTCP